MQQRVCVSCVRGWLVISAHARAHRCILIRRAPCSSARAQSPICVALSCFSFPDPAVAALDGAAVSAVLCSRNFFVAYVRSLSLSLFPNALSKRNGIPHSLIVSQPCLRERNSALYIHNQSLLCRAFFRRMPEVLKGAVSEGKKMDQQ